MLHRATDRASSRRRLRRGGRGRSGFTLAESLIAITLATTAGAALMLTMGTSVETTKYTLDKIIAAGLAEQVMDEIMGTRYAGAGVGPTQWPLGPNSVEAAGNGRELFDDTDDFHDFTASPPQDERGLTVGQADSSGLDRHPNFVAPTGYFNGWTQEIDVYYVDESDPTIRLADGVTSQIRAVEVRILEPLVDGRTRPLVTLRRVYAYVPGM